jgi:L-methionine (R)-S-oxide reductase
MAMNKESIYQALLPQLRSLIEGEDHLVAVLANTAALLHEGLDHFFWTGFYLVEGDELVLGPFQGPVACFRIKRGRGVCGSSWQQGQTLVVPDVELFPGHIACSSRSRSEIVVPLRDGHDRIRGVLDIDSTSPAAFDDTDRKYLEQVCRLLGQILR